MSPNAAGPRRPAAGPADVLVRIVERRRARLAAGGSEAPTAPAAGAPTGEAFLEALRQRRGRAVIAEVKMGSPRLGSLAERLDPIRQARLYAEHGAAALSVVVEPEFFHGSYELLARCREASVLPALAKDFLVDERQLEWARRAGASAVLLVAALHDRQALRRYARAARDLGMVPLVETHDPADLQRLAGADWELVGVNNRDLRTFEVSLEHSIALLPKLPAGALKVAESGIAGAAEVRRLAQAGFDAFLVGESLLLADDPAAKLRELVS